MEKPASLPVGSGAAAAGVVTGGDLVGPTLGGASCVEVIRRFTDLDVLLLSAGEGSWPRC